MTLNITHVSIAVGQGQMTTDKGTFPVIVLQFQTALGPLTFTLDADDADVIAEGLAKAIPSTRAGLVMPDPNQPVGPSESIFTDPRIPQPNRQQRRHPDR